MVVLTPVAAQVRETATHASSAPASSLDDSGDVARSPGRPIRTVIAEDEGLFRDLLRVALAQEPSIEVVGAFPTGESAVEGAPALAPDVAILDIELGGPLNGIQVGRLLRRQFPRLGVILLTNHQDPQFLASVPKDSVAGWSYLLKKSVGDLGTLRRTIEGAAAGLVVLDPTLVKNMRPRAGGAIADLTPRQREILGLLAQGYTNAAIAERLVVTERTVENQTRLLYQQLGIEREQSGLHPRVTAVLHYLQESQP
jgi:DNA-binding NarL/FixJ family response regulator